MLTGGDRANVRFARNSVTTSGASSGYSLAIVGEVRPEDRHGHGVGVQRRQPAARGAERRGDRAAVARQPRGDAAARAADLRRRRSRTSTTRRRRRRSGAPARSAPRSTRRRRRRSTSAGFVETSAQIQAVATSKGQFAYDRFTAADYNLTARTPDGTGSGWASKSFNELRLLDPTRARGRGDRQGGALAQSRRRSSPANTPSSSSRRRWPI